MLNVLYMNIRQSSDRTAQKALCHFRYRSNARRLSQWAERSQPTSSRQSADVIMTEAKLPKQPPGKTFVISAHAAMLNDLPLWAERNRKIDALRCAPTAKPPAFPNSLRSIIQ